MNLSAKDIERFWSKVDIQGEGDCWNWTLSCSPKGYGYFNAMKPLKKVLQAHRVSYTLSRGDIPEGKQIHHICSNPKCVNPNHLVPLTPKEHAAIDRTGDRSGSRKHPERLKRGDEHWSKFYPERIARGDRNGARTHPEKFARGERHYLAVITEEEVKTAKSMHRDGLTGAHIARVLGKKVQTIYKILSGKNWKGVE